jgi:uncharacterized membrane protein
VARSRTSRPGAGLWLIPLLCLLGGVLLSLGTIALDRHFHDEIVPQSITGNAVSARTLLSTVASSMMTLITLVLTVTTVAVQLAMGQFSPRIVRRLLHDRKSQLSHGLFIATFVYALLAIREVENSTGGPVPGLTVLVAYVLVFASLAVLVLYVDHAAQSLRVDGLIDLVGDELRAQLSRRYPAPEFRRVVPADDGHLVLARDPGVVVGWDTGGLVEVARRAGCTLELVPVMGDFVPAGTPLFRVHGLTHPGRVPAEEIARLVDVGSERTHGEDPAYGFRKLVDIAERAISTPFEDPTTAVQAIDRLHDCLRQLAPRTFPSGLHHDADGTVRLRVRSIGWDGYVRLAFDEIRLAGACTPQVTRRLRAALEDLGTVAPPERQGALRRQLELLGSGVRRSFPDDPDRDAAYTPDEQGIGSGPDVVEAVDART